MAGAGRAKMPSGLEQSGPVFDRARRLARSLFGDVEASVVLVGDGAAWRSHDPIGLGPEDSPIACAAVAEGRLQWISDVRQDPRFRDRAAADPTPDRRFVVVAPIHL